MNDLKEKILSAGNTPTSVAREIGVHPSNVFHFLAGRRFKIGKASYKKIREFFEARDWLRKRRPSPIHECLICGKSIRISGASKADRTSTPTVPDLGTARVAGDMKTLSTIGRDKVRNSNGDPQSQTVAKESAAR